jgi:hypothetical protein
VYWSGEKSPLGLTNACRSPPTSFRVHAFGESGLRTADILADGHGDVVGRFDIIFRALSSR